ncbi:hypothetical protein [Sciscionella sediminilitoris]|uniref:hypothetical protein n=1 Tax=Sciscionella sediminilitoris TaxID=1445613 RepID=UPI0004DF51E3|nr:hypothetical protein [Sciscionella sp. SE31]
MQHGSGSSTLFRSVAPPLLGFVQSARPERDPDVVHLTYGAINPLHMPEQAPVMTLCGEQFTQDMARSPEPAGAPPCPMCLDMAMNDTASVNSAS